jgi:HEAT repeat protein
LSNVVNERAAYEDRVHGLTSGKVPEVKNTEDLATLAKQLTNPKEDEVVRHEIVNLLTRSNYQELEPLLFKILENPAEDQKFRAWTVQYIGGLLTKPGDIPVSPDLLNRVRKILSDSDLHVRREALLALSRAGDPQALEAVQGMLKSEAPEFDGMRDLAIRIVQTKNLRDQIPLIRPYLTSTNDTLRIVAMDTLGKWQDQESRPAIEAAQKEGSYRVKLCATAALKALDTGLPPVE